MSRLMQLSQQFKSLRFNAMAEHLEELVKQAEDNEISYLQFASLLVEKELCSRENRRIQLNRKKAGFRTLKRLDEFDLIIIDELSYLPLNKQGMFNLFQFINTLYEYRSVIMTTNKDFTNWNDFFMDENVAVPVIDRLIHHSHLFMMGGESYRLKNKLNR